MTTIRVGLNKFEYDAEAGLVYISRPESFMKKYTAPNGMSADSFFEYAQLQFTPDSGSWQGAIIR